jgi:ABC-type transporter Mla MlaB component
MPVTITHSNAGKTLVVTVEGPLDLSLAPYFWRLRQHDDERADEYVLDLGNVHPVRDSGVALILFLSRWTRRRRISLKLTNTPGHLVSRLARASIPISPKPPQGMAGTVRALGPTGEEYPRCGLTNRRRWA